MGFISDYHQDVIKNFAELRQTALEHQNTEMIHKLLNLEMAWGFVLKYQSTMAEKMVAHCSKKDVEIRGLQSQLASAKLEASSKKNDVPVMDTLRKDRDTVTELVEQGANNVDSSKDCRNKCGGTTSHAHCGEDSRDNDVKAHFAQVLAEEKEYRSQEDQDVCMQPRTHGLAGASGLSSCKSESQRPLTSNNQDVHYKCREDLRKVRYGYRRCIEDLRGSQKDATHNLELLARCEKRKKSLSLLISKQADDISAIQKSLNDLKYHLRLIATDHAVTSQDNAEMVFVAGNALDEESKQYLTKFFETKSRVLKVAKLFGGNSLVKESNASPVACGPHTVVKSVSSLEQIAHSEPLNSAGTIAGKDPQRVDVLNKPVQRVRPNSVSKPSVIDFVDLGGTEFDNGNIFYRSRKLKARREQASSSVAGSRICENISSAASSKRKDGFIINLVDVDEEDEVLTMSGKQGEMMQASGIVNHVS